MQYRYHIISRAYALYAVTFSLEQWARRIRKSPVILAPAGWLLLTKTQERSGLRSSPPSTTQ